MELKMEPSTMCGCVWASSHAVLDLIRPYLGLICFYMITLYHAFGGSTIPQAC